MAIRFSTLLILGMLSTPIFAADAERPIIQTVNALEPYQCSADNYIYRAGEQYTFEDGITRVCVASSRHGEWVAVPNTAPAK